MVSDLALEICRSSVFTVIEENMYCNIINII